MTQYEPVTKQGGIEASFDIPDDAIGVTVETTGGVMWTISYLRPLEDKSA